MTAYRDVTIYCDECEAEAPACGVPENDVAAAKPRQEYYDGARAHARLSLGWAYRDGRDYCSVHAGETPEERTARLAALDQFNAAAFPVIQAALDAL